MKTAQTITRTINGNVAEGTYYMEEDKYVFDASELRFPIPTHLWPQILTMGTRRFIADSRAVNADGDVMYATYTETRTPGGRHAIIRVFND